MSSFKRVAMAMVSHHSNRTPKTMLVYNPIKLCFRKEVAIAYCPSQDSAYYVLIMLYMHPFDFLMI